MPRDPIAWRKTKEKALELAKEGKSSGQIQKALQAAGLSVPSPTTIATWAKDGGYPLPTRHVWPDEIKRYAEKLIEQGYSPSKACLMIREKFGRDPKPSTLRGWVRNDKVWKVAKLLYTYRYGAPDKSVLRRIHEKLDKLGYSYLKAGIMLGGMEASITLEKGFELWQIGLFLEEEGEDQLAIDAAMVGHFTQSGFVEQANMMLKRRRVKRTEEESNFEDMRMAA